MSLFLAYVCPVSCMLFGHDLRHWHSVHNLAWSSVMQVQNDLITYCLKHQLDSGTWSPCLPDLSAGVLSVFVPLTKNSNLRSLPNSSGSTAVTGSDLRRSWVDEG